MLDVIHQISGNAPITPNGMPLFTLDMRGYTGQLASLHDGSGFLSSVIGSHGEGVIGQAAFVPVDTTGMGVSASSAVALNPVLILPVAMIMSVNHKLDMIQKSSEEILDYLKNKDKSKLQANLKSLAEIMKNYKYNIDNEREKTSNANLVKIIKRDSEEFIDFYIDALKRGISNKKVVHGDKEKDKIMDDLRRYQTAVYSYSFAAYLDVLLAENFKKDYLQSVIAKIEEYSLQYRELYEKCYDYMEEYMSTSVQSQTMKSVAAVSKFTGEALAKVPVLNKGPMDEALIKAGDRLKTADSKKRKAVLQDFANKQNSYIRPFVDNIKRIDEIYNEPKIIMMDRENIYLVQRTALA